MRFLLLLPPLLLSANAYAEPQAPLPSEQELAELPMSKCYTTAAKPPSSRRTLKNLPVEVSAGKAAGSDLQADFQGNVELSHGDRHLVADKISIDREQQRVNAEGGIRFEDGWLDIESETLSAEISSGTAELTDADYQFTEQLGRGKAERIALEDGNRVVMENASFTTCPEGDNSWDLQADEILINGDEEWGEAWGSWLYVKDTPVIYVPYFSFPVSSKRKSGFLFPSVGSSSDNGFEMETPWYWNIAPNMDATITPRYMDKRGPQLLTEYRYLTEKHYGQFNLEYMNEDKLLINKDERYLFHWEQETRWNKHWRGYFDYTTISDDNYLNDLGSDVASSTDNRLERTANIGYFEKSYQVNIRLLDYEELGDSFSSHRMLPAVEAIYHKPEIFPYVNFDWYSEAVYFDHSKNEIPTTSRLHLEPTLSIPFGGPSYNLLAETKLYQTFYDQNTKDAPFNEVLDSSVSRTLPSVRLLGALNFERDTSLFGDQYLQTLEPQIQYVYVPYENQDEIGIYDTNLLQYDYDALFRARRFIGLDRIADANQLTVGATTRYIDAKNRERLRFSLGQIFYLSDSDVRLADDETQVTENHSAIASELDIFLDQNWYFHNELQFDTNNGRTIKNASMINYQPEPNKRLQLNHRYLPEITESDEINQLGVLATWPIQPNIQLVSTWYKDLVENRTIETYVGLQFESCCYAIRVGYHRHLNTNFPDDDAPASSRDAFDSGVWINFVIKGFGGASTPGYQEMEADSIFGDVRNEYINN
ncbi:LPS-assembly protein LptD [Corallincola spongiicola]|uniref:LPS-assembly protein LptD n=1 Tax=Corallincola spongiicola TaxID=2520508 RepID=A0ABY1WNC6_9GAMM|nr:LPS assembly protein LptD [Corallincola spongiicola]TAA45072.1 LPS-assembly protein LptD [Corallincola spongiicola]